MAPFDTPHMIFYWRSMVTGPISYHFRDKARYWLKIAIFSYPLLYDSPSGKRLRIFSELSQVPGPPGDVNRFCKKSYVYS